MSIVTCLYTVELSKYVRNLSNCTYPCVCKFIDGPRYKSHYSERLVLAFPLTQAMSKEPKECAPEVMDSEDTLFLLYTSGSTGKPKGIVHTQAGYILYASMTHQVSTFISVLSSVRMCLVH